MLCFIELGLTVLGIAILITTLASGRFPLSNGRELRGAPAYLVGGLLTLVLPVGIIIACGVVGNKFAQGKEAEIEKDNKSYLWIDIVAIAGCGIPAGIIGAVGAKPKRRKKKKKRRPVADEYDDYEDRPVRRRRLDQEEDEQEERGGRSRRRDADDEDEYDVPRRRRRLDEDDDYRPPRRRRGED
jgi:hypothetical protein